MLPFCSQMRTLRTEVGTLKEQQAAEDGSHIAGLFRLFNSERVGFMEDISSAKTNSEHTQQTMRAINSSLREQIETLKNEQARLQSVLTDVRVRTVRALVVTGAYCLLNSKQ